MLSCSGLFLIIYNFCVLAVILDAANNEVYVTGYVTGSYKGISYLGAKDLLLLRYNTDGMMQWVRQMGSAGNDTVNGGERQNADILCRFMTNPLLPTLF